MAPSPQSQPVAAGWFQIITGVCVVVLSAGVIGMQDQIVKQAKANERLEQTIVELKTACAEIKILQKDVADLRERVAILEQQTGIRR